MQKEGEEEEKSNLCPLVLEPNLHHTHRQSSLRCQCLPHLQAGGFFLHFYWFTCQLQCTLAALNNGHTTENVMIIIIIIIIELKE